MSDDHIGCLIRDLRLALGYSQGRLATELRRLTNSTITREYVSRWERGTRSPGTYWLPHLATVLQVPRRTLDAERVKRREFLRLAATVPLFNQQDTTAELMASIAGGDPAPLAGIQTSHDTDLAVSTLATTDRTSLLHLTRWMDNGDTEVLRVNAAGILAKTRRDPDLLDSVALTLGRDNHARTRYLRALTARVGHTVPALAAEVLNPRDAGARWCSAWLLGQDGSPPARQALATALRRDPVRENVRTIGLILNGVAPCT